VIHGTRTGRLTWRPGHTTLTTRRHSAPPQQENVMAWKKPRVTEVSVAMEINCYACAEA
jgi:coenzyme PQQ precursor peptide PqqA